MTSIEQITEAARRLTPDEIRDRLADIGREEQILLAILRATLKDQRVKTPKREVVAQ
jgi:hypothetical protein